MGSFATNYEEIAAVLPFCYWHEYLVSNRICSRKLSDSISWILLFTFSLQPKAILKDEQRQSLLMVFWMPVIISNPVPAGLVLTGIVVSVSVSALMMALTVCLYREYHTLNIDEIMMKLRKEED